MATDAQTDVLQIREDVTFPTDPWSTHLRPLDPTTEPSAAGGCSPSCPRWPTTLQAYICFLLDAEDAAVAQVLRLGQEPVTVPWAEDGLVLWVVASRDLDVGQAVVVDRTVITLTVCRDHERAQRYLLSSSRE